MRWFIQLFVLLVFLPVFWPYAVYAVSLMVMLVILSVVTWGKLVFFINGTPDNDSASGSLLLMLILHILLWACLVTYFAPAEFFVRYSQWHMTGYFEYIGIQPFPSFFTASDSFVSNLTGLIEWGLFSFIWTIAGVIWGVFLFITIRDPVVEMRANYIRDYGWKIGRKESPYEFFKRGYERGYVSQARWDQICSDVEKRREAEEHKRKKEGLQRYMDEQKARRNDLL